ncbi:hypothetical protein EDB81DRAFT_899449 [Dactylonectria macrodidyma]|uniref:Uncharacterized protein n=1 Tax=Dactylonectria macrodidyma TaxID=307937 RepID=A0A9P9ERM5_9HYPO|nr:hypothetical protein EDB81DRAFT_899449 [Dactylonectria macrodidyma]
MKFSAAALLAISNGIVAMPWSGRSNSAEEINLRIEVSQSPVKHTEVIPSKLDICWLLCAQESIKCPENWCPSQQGECWTCCRSTGGDFGL